VKVAEGEELGSNLLRVFQSSPAGLSAKAPRDYGGLGPVCETVAGSCVIRMNALAASLPLPSIRPTAAIPILQVLFEQIGPAIG
jgi:hypothetical protein